MKFSKNVKRPKNPPQKPKTLHVLSIFSVVVVNDSVLMEQQSTDISEPRAKKDTRKSQKMLSLGRILTYLSQMCPSFLCSLGTINLRMNK